MHLKSIPTLLIFLFIVSCDWTPDETEAKYGPAKRDKTEKDCSRDFTPEKSKGGTHFCGPFNEALRIDRDFPRASFGQSAIENRVNDIRTWYSNSQEVINDNQSAVREYSRIDHVKTSDVEQRVKHYTISRTQSMIRLNFLEWENEVKAYFYFNTSQGNYNQGLYFAYISYGGYGCSDLRVYFDSEGNVVRLMEDYDGQGAISNEPLVATECDAHNLVKQHVEDYLKEAMEIIAQ